MILKKIALIFFFAYSLINGQTKTKIDTLKNALKQPISKELQLKLLDTLTKELIRNNSKEQVNYLEQYIALAKDLEEYDLMASKSRFLIQDYIYKGEEDIAQNICDSFLIYKSKFKKASSEAHLLLKRAATFYVKENFIAANEDYQNAHELFLKSGDSIFAADALFFSAQVNTDLNAFVASVKNYENAGKLYELLGDKQYALIVGAELIALYNVNGFYEKTLQESERLIEKAKQNKDYNAYALLLGQKISVYNKLEDYEKVRTVLDEIIKLKEEDRLEESWKGYYSLYILNHELIYAIRTGNLKEAEVLMSPLNAITKSKEIPGYLEMDVLNAKANYYEAVGDNKKLLPILKKLVNTTSKTNIDVQVKSRQKLADIYIRQANYKDALKLYETNLKIKDSVYTSQKTNAFLYYQAEFETEKRLRELVEQDTEIDRLESEQALARSRRNTLIAIIFSLVLLTFFTWRYGKSRRKQLTEKLKQNKEELKAFTEQLLKKSKEKAELQEQFNRVKNGITPTNTIDEFQELLSTKILTNDDWYDFKEKFLKVYPQFFNNIKNKGYKLTKSEERLIALEKLELDNKEIANMLGISVDSIFNNRYRLRKKLNAPNEISILEFFERTS